MARQSPALFKAADAFLVFALLAALSATVMRGFHGSVYYLFSRYCLLWIEFFVPTVVFLRNKGLGGSGAFALFPFWFALCCLYHGVSLTVVGEAQAALIHLTSVALIAFPFAELTGTDGGGKYWTPFCWLDCSSLLSCFWPPFTAFLRAFASRFGMAGCVSAWHTARPAAWNSGFCCGTSMARRFWPWSAACWSSTCSRAAPDGVFFYVPAAVLELIFLAAVALGASRNAMLTLMASFACIAAVGIDRSPLPARTKKFVAAAVCVLLLLLGAFSMNFIYRNVTHSIRTIWYGLTMLTNRIEIWGAVPKMLRDRPEALLWGLPYTKLMSVLNEYIPLEGNIAHMHSGYVHTLCGMGVPGGGLALAYTVLFFRDFFALFRGRPERGISAADQLLAVVPFSIWCVNRSFFCRAAACFLSTSSLRCFAVICAAKRGGTDHKTTKVSGAFVP